MNTTDKVKIEMNTTPTTNQRLVTILLILLIVHVSLLVIGIVVGLLMMSGWMMGTHGQTMNAMMSNCTDMMQNFQRP